VNIQSVEFAGAIARAGAPPPAQGLPQIAFAGRSNVGKSSLINRLLGRTRTPVARVSVTPGRTQQINFYRVRARGEAGGAEFFLVDLPGYGYARVPRAIRDTWRALIETYLLRSQELRGVVQLIDARHGATAEDRRMLEFLAALAVPTVIVFTKIDKLASSRRRETVNRWTAELELDEEQVVAFSARTGEGREELLGGLDALLGESGGTT
jgi:GTP-binding protein